MVVWFVLLWVWFGLYLGLLFGLCLGLLLCDWLGVVCFVLLFCGCGLLVVDVIFCWVCWCFGGFYDMISFSVITFVCFGCFWVLILVACVAWCDVFGLGVWVGG